MNLTTKLLLVLTASTMGVLAVNTYLGIEREHALFDADMRRDDLSHAAALAESVEAIVAQPQGIERVAAVVRRLRTFAGRTRRGR